MIDNLRLFKLSLFCNIIFMEDDVKLCEVKLTKSQIEPNIRKFRKTHNSSMDGAFILLVALDSSHL